MKRIILGTLLVVLLGGCTPAVKLDLNIDADVTEALPRDMAIEYLTEITQRYPAPITQKSFKPWNRDCKYFDDVWIKTSLPEERHPYHTSHMTYWTMNNPGYNQLSIHLVDEETKEECDIVYIITHEASSSPKHKELFVKVGKKVATALKSLGVEINRE